MPLILLFLVATTLAAPQTLDVQFGLRSYKLEYDEQRVLLESVDGKTVIQAAKCNQHILTDFKQRLEQKKKTAKNQQGEPARTIRYRENGVERFETQGTEWFSFLANLPEETRRMRMEDLLNCAGGSTRP